MPVDRFRVLALVQGIELSFLENTPKASCLASFMEVEVRSLFTLFSKAYRKPSFGAALPGDFTGLPSSSGEACLPSSAADGAPHALQPSSPPGRRASDPPTLQGHGGGHNPAQYLPAGRQSQPCAASGPAGLPKEQGSLCSAAARSEFAYLHASAIPFSIT